MDDESKIKKALLKKALGYIADDVVEEYLLDEDGNIKLSKKKVTKKPKEQAKEITTQQIKDSGRAFRTACVT